MCKDKTDKLHEEEKSFSSDPCKGDDCPCKDKEIVGLPTEDENNPIIHPSAPHLQKVMPTIRKDDGTKLGRNDRCPCNSGKKFKHCCWDLINQ